MLSIGGDEGKLVDKLSSDLLFSSQLRTIEACLGAQRIQNTYYRAAYIRFGSSFSGSPFTPFKMIGNMCFNLNYMYQLV